jgi:transmembrane sensor
MRVTEKMIQEFLNGRCNRRVATAVARHLRKNPEHWKKYLIDCWEEEAGQEKLPFIKQDRMLKVIRQKTYQPSAPGPGRRIIRIGVRITAVAASVLLLVGGGWIWMHRVKDRSQDTAAQHKSLPAVVEWQENANHSDQKVKMKLGDGSVVTLLPQSSIRYPKNFAERTLPKRDVYLEGQAFFDVARDKDRPFTVYTGEMSTTVLGTSFSITENKTWTLVKLFSGKVRVHPLKYQASDKDIFLKAGEQLKYETGANLATVSNFTISRPTSKLPETAASDENHDLVFDNTDLPGVMNRLTKHYHIAIAYNRSELSHMYFSGHVLASDSLSVILKVIANMNGLQVAQTTYGFMVHVAKE